MNQLHDMVKTQIEARGVTDPRVLEAMRLVPRAEFVSHMYRAFAYNDSPVAIDEGQTISQPYIVAFMSEALALKPESRVLEIGTGCGYQAAVLAELCAQVYTVEILAKLGNAARKRLQSLGYTNVDVKIGDGYDGWEEHAPYDGIIVTAAASTIPPPLIEQLAIGGRLVIPIGAAFDIQKLLIVHKTDQGLQQRDVMPVRFVPLTGAHGD